jgi:TetR/AcrR family tetracycline transcriptional repressor
VTTRRAGAPAKVRLSRETIVDSALTLADAEGLDAVTIRRLAQDQGVTPMALYWHFKDKDLLLDGVVERMLAEVEIPSYPAQLVPPWDERIRDVLVAMLQVFRRHPEVANLVHERFLGCEAGLDLAEIFFTALREGGFDEERRAEIGIQALHNVVVLVTMEPGERAPADSEEEIAQRIRAKKVALENLAPERYPNVILCAGTLVSKPVEDSYLSLGLEVMVEGIRAVQAKLVPAAPVG